MCRFTEVGTSEKHLKQNLQWEETLKPHSGRLCCSGKVSAIYLHRELTDPVFILHISEPAASMTSNVVLR